jgi:hypothetical protein
MIHDEPPEMWESLGLDPAELGAGDDDVGAMMLSVDVGACVALDAARRRWPASRWAGLYVGFDLPPGADYPEIWGALHAWLWWFDRQWRLRFTIEYPSSLVGRDPRWPAWRDALVDELGHAVGVSAATPSSSGS